MTAISEHAANASEFDLERELALWDWARTAGVSSDELRAALRAALAGAETPGRRLPKAA